MNDRVEVRRARADDWLLARDTRLSALADSPEAFGSTLEDAERRDEAFWRTWAEGSFIEGGAVMFLAFLEGARPVGIVVGTRQDRGDDGERPDEVHLFSMWVAPEARRRGVGRHLLDAVEEWARTLHGVTDCVLCVTVGNEAAERLYAGAGFVPDGRVPLRQVRPGSALMERTMRRRLR